MAANKNRPRHLTARRPCRRPWPAGGAETRTWNGDAYAREQVSHIGCHGRRTSVGRPRSLTTRACAPSSCSRDSKKHPRDWTLMERLKSSATRWRDGRSASSRRRRRSRPPEKGTRNRRDAPPRCATAATTRQQLPRCHKPPAPLRRLCANDAPTAASAATKRRQSCSLAAGCTHRRRAGPAPGAADLAQRSAPK